MPTAGMDAAARRAACRDTKSRAPATILPVLPAPHFSALLRCLQFLCETPKRIRDSPNNPSSASSGTARSTRRMKAASAGAFPSLPGPTFQRDVDRRAADAADFIGSVGHAVFAVVIHPQLDLALGAVLDRPRGLIGQRIFGRD